MLECTDLLRKHGVSFNYVIRESVDQLAPTILALLAGVTPQVLAILYDYWKNHDKSGFKIRIRTKKGVLEISSSTTPEDLWLHYEDP